MRGQSTKSVGATVASREGAPESEEQRFKQKCKELKKRINEVEESNEIATLALSRTKTAIRRLRLEYAILLERLEERAIVPAFDGEDMQFPPTPIVLDESLTNNSKSVKGGAAKKNGRKIGGRSGSTLSGSNATTGKTGKIRDPDLPKRPTNAYLIFCEMEKDRIRQELEAKNPGVVNDLSRTLTEAWKNLDDESRKPYYKLYEDDKDRYQREMAVYNSKKDDETESALKSPAKKQKLESPKEMETDTVIQQQLNSDIDTPASELNEIEENVTESVEKSDKEAASHNERDGQESEPI
ncbi:hypothetical protein CAAN1_22S00254 [[Candida] anglica]|uniref:HMG box domain-containing protein n=1 Tax=[Candida] anglica TaxID=148631 RepID=A0ABP0ENJ6_9ASCO